MVKLNQSIQLITGFFLAITITLMVATSLTEAGNKGNKGSDIILYKNNLLIRGKKGKGNLLIADGHGGHHGHDHGGHKDHQFIMEAIMMSNKGKGKGNKGKGGQMGGMNMKSKGGNSMEWEQMIMGHGGGGHGYGEHGF